jgi:cell division protein FtsI/penicillin-binding protein 2
LRLARAYLELTRRSREPAVAPALEGLALSAQKGTGKAAGAELPNTPMLVKTGTAPCTHAKKAPGDGFALLAVPASHPRAVLLVRLHGRPGYIAAGLAGRMMAEVESGRSGE